MDKRASKQLGHKALLILTTGILLFSGSLAMAQEMTGCDGDCETGQEWINSYAPGGSNYTAPQLQTDDDMSQNLTPPAPVQSGIPVSPIDPFAPVQIGYVGQNVFVNGQPAQMQSGVIAPPGLGAAAGVSEEWLGNIVKAFTSNGAAEIGGDYAGSQLLLKASQYSSEAWESVQQVVGSLVRAGGW